MNTPLVHNIHKDRLLTVSDGKLYLTLEVGEEVCLDAADLRRIIELASVGGVLATALELQVGQFYTDGELIGTFTADCRVTAAGVQLETAHGFVLVSLMKIRPYLPGN